MTKRRNFLIEAMQNMRVGDSFGYENPDVHYYAKRAGIIVATTRRPDGYYKIKRIEKRPEKICHRMKNMAVGEVIQYYYNGLQTQAKRMGIRIKVKKRKDGLWDVERIK